MKILDRLKSNENMGFKSFVKGIKKGMPSQIRKKKPKTMYGIYDKAKIHKFF